MAKIEITKTELVWPGKYNEDGTRKEVPRVNLPFQVIETIGESRATREAKKIAHPSLFDTYEGKEGDTFEKGWKNKLIWGDNLLVMGSLMEKFAGKIDLIYIDPPFFTGTDQKIVLIVGEENQSFEKQPSLLEEAAYRNVWRSDNNSYFEWMFNRLQMIRSLLSSKGVIFIRHDQYWSHYVKLIADEVFGKSKLANELIVSRIKKNVTQQGRISIPIATDSLFLYFVGSEAKFYDIYKKLYEKREAHWRAMDSSGIRPNPDRIIEGRTFYPPPGRHFTFTQERVDRLYQEGKVRINPKTDKIQYWVEESDKQILDSNWTDVSGYSFTTGYPTENSEKLLERVIKACSQKGDLVADFFGGSGTTSAVAERINRRWITCDVGRYAIHTIRKRLLGIENCKPFEVLNLGKYERQYWQGVTFGESKGNSISEQALYEYLAFVLRLYGAQPLSGMTHSHGKKGKALVHIGAVDAPVTIDEINQAIEECLRLKQTELHILGWEWEMGLAGPNNEYRKGGLMHDEARKRGIKLLLFQIPREVMEQQAVDKGEIQFFELAYLEAEIQKPKKLTAQMELKDFVIPNTELIPEEVRSKIKKWSDYIDYWAVDWDFQNDTFMQGWVAYRTRKERSLPLISDPHTYEKSGKYRVLVKVIDIFGNDTSQAFNVEVK